MLRNGWENVAALYDPTRVFFQSTFSAFEEDTPLLKDQQPWCGGMH